MPRSLRPVLCLHDGCGGTPNLPPTWPRPTAMLSDGSPYLIGRSPSFPYTFTCFACHRSSTHTASTFARAAVLTRRHFLPPPDQPDLADSLHSLLLPYLKSLMGDGCTYEQAVDLFFSGWNPAELAELPPPAPDIYYPPTT